MVHSQITGSTNYNVLILTFNQNHSWLVSTFRRSTSPCHPLPRVVGKVLTTLLTSVGYHLL